ncbi:MAG TPA: DUF6544 family protein, partial [bacterium]
APSALFGFAAPRHPFCPQGFDLSPHYFEFPMSARLLLGVFVAVLGVAAVLAAVIAAGRYRFNAAINEEVSTAFTGATAGDRTIDVAAATQDLPEPVRNYLRLALGDRAPAVVAVRLRHGGGFRLKPNAAWMPLQGEEYFTISPPRYIWHATVHMVPGIWFDVRDYYGGGAGGVLARLNSTITIARSSGSEVATSALIRWAGEAVWFPQAFLDTERFTWQAVGPREAALVIRDNGISARLVLRFAPEGWIERITTDDRYLELDGRQVKRPFVVYCRDWRRVSGVLVPHQAEAVWKLEAGDFSYARFEIQGIEYNRPERYR